MIVFVDASVLVAMIAQEPEAIPFAKALDRQDTCFCSALALWEAAAALCRRYLFSPSSARDQVDIVRDRFQLQIAVIGEREYDLALDAYAKFGKGRHPAALNMGDCFAYACAKTKGAAMMCKGDDFPKTDINVLDVTPFA